MTSLRWTHAVVAFLSLVIVGPVVWMALDREPPFKIIDAKPIPNPASEGDLIDMQFVVRASGRQGCEATFQRMITGSDKRLFTYEPRASSYGFLTAGIHHMSTTTPLRWPKVAPGPAEIRLNFLIRCNPLHEVMPIVYRSPPFRIVSN